MTTDNDNDLLVASAAQIFLQAVRAKMPWINNEHDQIAGQDEAAIAMWLLGDTHGRDRIICRPEDLPAISAADVRLIDETVQTAIAAIRTYVGCVRSALAISDPSPDVLSDLVACVRLLQFYSLPRFDETLTDLMRKLSRTN